MVLVHPGPNSAMWKQPNQGPGSGIRPWPAHDGCIRPCLGYFHVAGLSPSLGARSLCAGSAWLGLIPIQPHRAWKFGGEGAVTVLIATSVSPPHFWIHGETYGPGYMAL